jgi:hypothetical protein
MYHINLRGSLYDAVSISDYIASNARMITESQIWKDVQGSGRGLLEVLPQSGQSVSRSRFELSTPEYKSTNLLVVCPIMVCEPSSLYHRRQKGNPVVPQVSSSCLQPCQADGEHGVQITMHNTQQKTYLFSAAVDARLAIPDAPVLEGQYRF